MRADIGGISLKIGHLPRRRARGRLFTSSGRNLLLLGLTAAALVLGFTALTEWANSSPIHGENAAASGR